MGRCWERRGKCRPTARRDSYLKKNRCLGVRQPGLQQSSPETVSLQKRKKPAAQIPGPLSTLKKTLLASTLCTYRRYTAGKPRCDGCTTLFLRICCKINQPTPFTASHAHGGQLLTPRPQWALQLCAERELIHSNAPINVNPVRGEGGQGAGIWCPRLSPCRTFDRVKRPRGRDIWLWPTEAWYQFRSGYQVRPSRLSESHAVGERCEGFICFNRHNPIL